MYESTLPDSCLKTFVLVNTLMNLIDSDFIVEQNIDCNPLQSRRILRAA
jgi:hypothetical protein